MQFKNILIALTFGVVAIASPLDASVEAVAREDLALVNSGVLSPADIQQCGSLDRRWERRQCREDKYE